MIILLPAVSGGLFKDKQTEVQQRPVEMIFAERSRPLIMRAEFFDKIRSPWRFSVLNVAATKSFSRTLRSSSEGKALKWKTTISQMLPGWPIHPCVLSGGNSHKVSLANSGGAPSSNGARLPFNPHKNSQFNRRCGGIG